MLTQRCNMSSSLSHSYLLWSNRYAVSLLQNYFGMSGGRFVCLYSQYCQYYLSILSILSILSRLEHTPSVRSIPSSHLPKS